MAGWKDRSTVVPSASSGGGWKSRSTVVPSSPAAPTSSAGGAALRGFGQGLTAEFGDELGAGLQAGLQRVANNLPEGSLEWAGISNDFTQDPAETYRQAREENREQLLADRREHTAAALAGNVAGGVVTSIIAPGSGYGQAAALGAAAGLGDSTADLTRPSVRNVGEAVSDTLTGVAAGLGGQLVGNGLGAVAGRGSSAVRDWALRRSSAGIAAARETAEAQAADLVGKNVRSLRGDAGSAASIARNTLENIEGINIPANARQTVGELRGALKQQISHLDDSIEAARAAATAQGVDLSGAVSGRQGEFLSKGSRLDKAQKAAAKIPSYESAKAELLARLEAMAGQAADDVLPDSGGALRDAQAALKSDPRFLDLKQNVLKNSLSDFPTAAEEAGAKREAFQTALSSQEEDAASLAQRLLSGDEARSQIGQRLQRYAAPLTGSLLGAGAGGLVGLSVGNDPTDAAVYALGGAGVRPALAAGRRLLANPAVQNAGWTTLRNLAEKAPESFGEFAGAVASAAVRGPNAIAALDKVLRDTSPAWRSLREQQERQTKGGR